MITPSFLYLATTCTGLRAKGVRLCVHPSRNVHRFRAMMPRKFSVLHGSHPHPHHDESKETAASIDSGSPPTASNKVHQLSSFTGKVVPLGSDFSVRRILPFAKQRAVGPFVFLDHIGPVALTEHAMNVGPHPHIGLMTITYLYEGAILHRDSTGAEQLVIPGEVNGMVAGKGVTHSERGQLEDIAPFLSSLQLPPPTGSHGLQIWMALSKQGQNVPPSFHHGPAVSIDGKYATLVVGQANGKEQASIPIDPELGSVVYVDLHFPSKEDSFQISNIGGNGTSVSDPSLELGIYVSTGSIQFQDGWGDLTGTSLDAGNMMVAKVPDATTFQASIKALSNDARTAILGGTPLPEKRHIFWNFVATSREMVQSAADAWDRLDRTVFGKVVNEANDDSIPLPQQNAPARNKS